MAGILNDAINNAISNADNTKALNGHVCITVTPLYHGGVEFYFYYDGKEEQTIALTKEQKDFLVKELSYQG